LLFVSACAGILVFGIVLAILGAMFGLPAMRARLQIGLAQQGTLILLLYLGISVSSLIVGPLIDHLGNKTNLFASSLIVALAMVCFANAHSFAAASGAAILLGLGGGGLNTCTNVLVSELYAAHRGPMLNLLGIFFGVGAISVPLTAASIEGHFTISQLFLFCAVLAAVCALWYAVISFPPAITKQAFSFGDLFEAARYSGVLLLAFILFLESGNEACIAGWTSTYVDATGHSARIATLVLATFWGALMLSRILAAGVLRGIGKTQLVVNAAFMSVGGCAVLLSARSLILLFVGTALSGDSTDWIVVWPDLPHDTGDCWRPLLATSGNGVWSAIFDCACWRHDFSLGGGASVAASWSSCGHDRAGAGSARNCWLVACSFPGRAQVDGAADRGLKVLGTSSK
jgi:fucose permease